MTYLFDTSVILSFFHNNSPGAADYIRRVQERQIVASLSAITYYEIWRGVHTERQLRQLKTLLRPYSIQAFSKQTARVAAEIYKSFSDKQQARQLSHDILIAATAEYYHLTIVTTNIKHFELFPLQHSRIVGV